MEIKISLQIPEKLRFLLHPKRYKILYGGRGGAKSWTVARVLLWLGLQKKLRILCAREFQNSIKDSVHKLLSDQIRSMGLESVYDTTNTAITGCNGTEFFFEGLRHNISKIKSFEGIDIAWVEEAQTVSKSSWETLIPTVRKENSEIWATLNPELETDETYQRFVVKPPEEATIVKVNWYDNKWFPDVLKQEMEQLQKRDYDAYLNIWLGECRQVLEGAIYKEELRLARTENRITNVPYTSTKPVQTFWDLGYADLTSIWFVQSIGHEFRLIDFYQNQFQKIHHYLDVLQKKSYIYSKHYLPHDARNNYLNTDKTTEGFVKAAFPNANVIVLPNLGQGAKQKGIDAAREIFGQCWFDRIKCADGIQVLSHYRYDRDLNGNWTKTPLHDDASNGADAFRYFAVAIRQDKEEKPRKSPALGHSNQSWMNM